MMPTVRCRIVPGQLVVLILFSLVSSLLFIFVKPRMVSAAAAQCYMKTGTNVVTYRTEPCDSDTMKTAFQVYGSTPVDDKCYLLIPWGVQPSDQTAEPCLTWAKAASSQTSQAPPKCKKYDGNIDDYNKNTADVTKLSDIGCDELKKLLTDSGNVTDITTPGYCYIGIQNQFKAGTYSVVFDTCWGILVHFAAAEQSKQIAANNALTNPDRAKALNCGSPDNCIAVNPLVNLVKYAINLFSVMFGIIVTGVIIWSGFTYARAGGDPNTTAEAKKRIRNAIISIALYVFLWALMMWLIPGGPF